MSSTPATLDTAVRRQIESLDGTRVVYDLYDNASRTVALIVPGFWRTRRHPSMIALANVLNDRGYGAAVLDPRGHGESGGTYAFNLHEHEDTAAVANDLLKNPSIDRIALVGFSYG